MSRRDLVIGAGLMGALGAGLYARFVSLGSSPLAFDEYYFIRSVENLLDFGYPRFPSGGVYSRGILVQYLTAGSIMLFGSEGFAFRLPAALLSVAAVGVTYLYARQYVARSLAVAVAVVLLLSSWQVEFARFARMYTALQLTSLGLLIAVHRAYVLEHWKLRYLPHVLIAVGCAVHSLSLLLTPLLFIPYLRPTLIGGLSPAARVRFGLVGLVVSGAAMAHHLLDPRNLGVTDSLPADYAAVARSSLRLPDTALWSPGVEGSQVLLIAFGAIGLLLGAQLWSRQRRGEPFGREMLLSLAVLASAIHQLALAGLAALILLLRYAIHRPSLHPRSVYLKLAFAGLLCASWLAYALVRPEALLVTGTAETLRGVRLSFFAFPDFYSPIFATWRDELPYLGLLFGLGLGGAVLLRARAPLEAWLRHPAAVVLWLLLCLTLLKGPGLSTRYFFFIYPAMLTTLALTISELIESAAALPPPLTLRGLRWPKQLPAAAVLLAVFALSDDFQPAHLLRAGSEEVRFRQGRWEPFQAVWFWRYDFAEPARHLSSLAAANGRSRIINVNQPPVSYYLGREHAVFVPREVGRFQAVSRERGTVELWSNQRLLSSSEELRDYTRCADTVWLVRHRDPDRAGWPFFRDPAVAGFREEEIWLDRYLSGERVALGRDGRIEARRIELAEPGLDPCH